MILDHQHSVRHPRVTAACWWRRTWPRRLRYRAASTTADSPAQQADGQDDDSEYSKQPTDVGGEAGNASEAQERCDESDHEECHGPIQHGPILLTYGRATDMPPADPASWTPPNVPDQGNWRNQRVDLYTRGGGSGLRRHELAHGGDEASGLERLGQKCIEASSETSFASIGVGEAGHRDGVEGSA